MIPYVFIWLLVFVPALFCLKPNNTATPAYPKILFLTVLGTGIFVGIRDMIGGYDIYAYFYYYRNTLSFSHFFTDSSSYFHELFSFHKEIGYQFCVSISKMIWDSFPFFLFCISFFFYFSIYLTIRRFPYCNLIFFIIFSSLFTVSFIYLRQIIALAFLWLSLICILEKKNIIACALFFCAMTFHYTSAVFLPVFFLTKRKTPPQIFGILLVASIVLTLGNLGSFLFPIFEVIFPSRFGETEEPALNVLRLTQLFFFILIYIWVSNCNMNSKYDIVMKNMSVMYIVISIVGLRYDWMTRILWIFQISFAYIIVLFIHVQKKAILTFLLIFLFSFMFFRDLVRRDAGNFIPYKCIFIDTERDDIHSYLLDL